MGQPGWVTKPPSPSSAQPQLNGGHLWAQVYVATGPSACEGRLQGRRRAEARRECGVGVMLRRGAHTVCTCRVQGPCMPRAILRPCKASVGLGVSDEEPWGWWAESEFSPRAACPQSPGLHYLPAEHWPRGVRVYPEGLDQLGWDPRHGEQLLLIRQGRGTAGTQPLLGTLCQPTIQPGAVGASCLTSPRLPLPRSLPRLPAAS